MFPRRPTFKAILLAATVVAAPLIALPPMPATAQAVVSVGIQIAPPLLPVYAQPPIPAPGYIWTPGYWAYSQAGYYWVPGTWVQPPAVNMLWTPPYWAWLNGAYVFHAGYWGPHVGFYGGVNYGHGYDGNGYSGGRWNGGHFAYNRTVNNFGSVHVTNIYSAAVTSNNRSKVSFVGGAHGLRAEPTAQERAAGHDRHIPPTAIQTQHAAAAVRNPAMAESHNHGHPAMATTSRPAAIAPHANTAHPVERAAPHQAAAPHPVEHAAPHPVAGPHPVAAPHPQSAPHPAAPARPMEHAAPHPVEHAAPHPAAPRAAPAHEERPQDQR